MCSVSAPRSRDTLSLHPHPSQPLMLDSMSSIDLVGLLPLSCGFTYLLTSVVRFTRWPEAIHIITTITAEAIAQAFLSSWIARFGVPYTIVTNHGRQFELQLWNTLMTLLGSKRAWTTHLSFPNQWHGRAISSPAEGPSQPHVGCAATGTSQYSDSTEGGHILYCSRDGVWYNPPSSWRIVHPLFHSFVA